MYNMMALDHMNFNHEPDTIPWNGPIPEGLLRVLVDYRAIINHLLMLGLYHRIGSDRALRDLGKAWFVEHYKGKYKIHYLDSAASFAMQHIKSWRSLGGDITALPYIRKPIARLNNDLYTIKELSPDGHMNIQITVAPGECVYMDFKVNHRHFSEWSKNRAGALVIQPHGLRLVFTNDEKTTIDPFKDGAAAIDTNLDRIVVARSDGQIRDINISDIATIQQNHKRKREMVQNTMSHNPKKAERLITKHREREQNRVNDWLHKKIHGKDNEFLSFVGNRLLGVEELSSTTQNLLENDHGRKHNERLSKWIHGEVEHILTHHHSATKEYYTRGTSGFCPFDGSPVKTNYQGVWRQSYCPKCDIIYDRDHIEAIHGLLRLLIKHKKGQPWALVKDVFGPSVEKKFKKNSVITLTPKGVSIGTSLPETVSLFAPNVPSSVRSKSVTGIGCKTDVVRRNRYDTVCSNGRSKKTGYDAKTRKRRR